VARTRLSIGLAILAMLLVAQCAISGVATWTQLPDMNQGFNFSSEVKVPSLVADDWLSQNGFAVTDLHWWGAYWTPNFPVPPDGTYYSDSLGDAAAGGIESFNVAIYSDVPAGVGVPFSRPGQQLWSQVVSATESSFGATAAGHQVYQYDVLLDEDDWFQPTTGEIYWVTIQANLSDPLRQWGWHEAATHFNDAAVQNFKGSGWYALENNQYKNDMAFELTTTQVPEPGSLLALGVSMVGLAGFAVRRRRA
jgi:hypothetical protein